MQFRQENENKILKKLFMKEAALELMEKFCQDYDVFQLPLPEWKESATGEWTDSLDHHPCKQVSVNISLLFQVTGVTIHESVPKNINMFFGWYIDRRLCKITSRCFLSPCSDTLKDTKSILAGTELFDSSIRSFEEDHLIEWQQAGICE